MKSVQLPDEVYERVEKLAAQDHVSVDRLVAAMVNERADDWSRLQKRASTGSIEKLKHVLAKISDAPADAADRL